MHTMSAMTLDAKPVWQHSRKVQEIAERFIHSSSSEITNGAYYKIYREI